MQELSTLRREIFAERRRYKFRAFLRKKQHLIPFFNSKNNKLQNLTPAKIFKIEKSQMMIFFYPEE